MTRFLLLALLAAASSSAHAIVIRDDVDDARYRIEASEFPALVDVPEEGHGVLIAPQWVLTAAHAVSWQTEVKEVHVGGVARRIERIVVHPGYRTVPKDLIAKVMESGDATPITDILAVSDDVALLKLAEPVTDVEPAQLYDGDALGRTAKIIGKGATGTGREGHSFHGPNRTELRRAFNTISSAEGRWLGYVFDLPSKGLPLEGMSGNGDSGGPVLVEIDGEWRVAGLTSWKRVEGHVAKVCPGMYGQTAYAVRVGNYAEWIGNVLVEDLMAGIKGGAGEAAAP